MNKNIFYILDKINLGQKLSNEEQENLKKFEKEFEDTRCSRAILSSLLSPIDSDDEFLTLITYLSANEKIAENFFQSFDLEEINDHLYDKHAEVSFFKKINLLSLYEKYCLKDKEDLENLISQIDCKTIDSDCGKNEKLYFHNKESDTSIKERLLKKSIHLMSRDFKAYFLMNLISLQNYEINYSLLEDVIQHFTQEDKKQLLKHDEFDLFVSLVAEKTNGTYPVFDFLSDTLRSLFKRKINFYLENMEQENKDTEEIKKAAKKLNKIFSVEKFREPLLKIQISTLNTFFNYMDNNEKKRFYCIAEKTNMIKALHKNYIPEMKKIILNESISKQVNSINKKHVNKIKKF